MVLAIIIFCLLGLIGLIVLIHWLIDFITLCYESNRQINALLNYLELEVDDVLVVYSVKEKENG